MSFHLTAKYATEHGEELDLIVELDALIAEDAIEEAASMLAAEYDGMPALSAIRMADVFDCREWFAVDLNHVRAQVEAKLQRQKDSLAEWERQYEEIRDELGHRRTLLRRNACPQAHVTIMEDRLKGHLAARP